MVGLTQVNRSIRVFTALGDDVLLFSAMSGTDRLSTLFEYSLELISEDPEIDLNALLGTDLTIEVDTFRDGTRYFHGFIAHCAHISSGDAFAKYEVVIKPWFWFLTRTSDCRIFQEMTVPDIIKQVFGDEGFSDFEDRLTGSYETWDYCVQYRETDFNFLSRLMEQEGIYYYFKHSSGLHKLILCDAITAHEPDPDYAEVKYYPVTYGQARDEDSLQHWNIRKRLQPGKFVMRDFNFEDPKADMQVNDAFSGQHARADYEIYDYPGEYPLRGAGETLVGFRTEEAQAQLETLEGSGDVQGMCSGNLFTLTECERADQNRDYLITSASYSISLDDYTSGGGHEVEFTCSLTAIIDSQQYRAPRVTPKPLVQGPQTAIVVGPAGEEIWTDQYGRVKLQFHWDRYGTSDENSSCWVRVSQVWAGANWGAIHIPRIGQEVIVECLEGDPDRPIITGRVYNGDNAVPYDLPANATQSGIKSRSSKSGSGANFNEIRMEDKKGSEQLYVHAEKNQDNIVENDETTAVGHDRTEDVGNDETISIGNDRTETVGNNETITIGVDRTENVGSNETITIGADRTENVGSNESITIGSNRTESVGEKETINIGADRSVTIGANKTEMVGASKNEIVARVKTLTIGSSYAVTVASKMAETVGGDQLVTIAKGNTTSIGKSQTVDVGDDQTVTVGKNLVIDAGDSITIKTGKASITMKKDGTIKIAGKDITIDGKGAINQKAKKNVVIKGKKILQN